jgi:hypothetical protein
MDAQTDGQTRMERKMDTHRLMHRQRGREMVAQTSGQPQMDAQTGGQTRMNRKIDRHRLMRRQVGREMDAQTDKNVF